LAEYPLTSLRLQNTTLCGLSHFFKRTDISLSNLSFYTNILQQYQAYRQWNAIT